MLLSDVVIFTSPELDTKKWLFVICNVEKGFGHSNSCIRFRISTATSYSNTGPALHDSFQEYSQIFSIYLSILNKFAVYFQF